MSAHRLRERRLPVAAQLREESESGAYQEELRRKQIRLYTLHQNLCFARSRLAVQDIWIEGQSLALVLRSVASVPESCGGDRTVQQYNRLIRIELETL